MSARFSHKNWYLAVVVLALILALAACGPFGRKQEPVVAPTQTPPPTATPMAAIATYTPTVVPATPTPTATFTPLPSVEEEPTPTSTPPVQAGGGELAVAPAAYKVVKTPKIGDVIRNRSFEEGFDEKGVALEWTPFSTDGDAVYAWADEVHFAHVSHGSHAQLMRIMGPAEFDRYIGIYQTVEVVAGETYTLALHGLIRSSIAKEDDIAVSHRIQWAIDDQGGTNWQGINREAWTDSGWNEVPLDEKEPAMNVYVRQITPTTDKLTLFIRCWTKWPLFQSEAKYYVDGVFLEGPIPGEETVVQVPLGTGEQMPTTGGNAIWVPIAGVILVLGLALWEARRTWGR